MEITRKGERRPFLRPLESLRQFLNVKEVERRLEKMCAGSGKAGKQRRWRKRERGNCFISEQTEGRFQRIHSLMRADHLDSKMKENEIAAAFAARGTNKSPTLLWAKPPKGQSLKISHMSVLNNACFL